MSQQVSRALLDQATVAISQLKKRLAAVESASREPIAIVGMGCRYPGGVTDPDSLWRLLDGGVDAVTEVPPERWDVDALYDPDPDARGKMMTRSGGFLREIDQFDPAFFGISPREAVSIDPQQRLLLETSWEALEHGGIPPDQLTGSSTGVFVGLMYQEYGSLIGGLDKLDGHVGMGSASSVAAGRISYTLGLQGPCMTVDTACSSSLVTVHLAVQALRQGECALALAGGAALMLTPMAFVEFSRLRGLSPDGRCKSFSADANGVGWAEGCGMLVLERLSDAQRNGHNILAVIRGTAVNQDGRSNGLTAPNGPSQVAVIRRALAQAGLRPADVQYVECHGTGTPLGDPIEVQALGTALADGREADKPALIGSIKSNLGHTQAAAGAAGIMKVVLSLSHDRIPKNLHYAAPSPHIAWSELPLRVASEPTPWHRGEKPRVAGVSSFGVSGTNAHVVIEEAPVPSKPSTTTVPAVASAPAAASETVAATSSTAEPGAAPVVRTAHPIVLSARTTEGVTAAASRLLAHIKANPEQTLGDVAYSLATTRTHHDLRLGLAATTRESLIEALEVAAQGETPRGGVRAAAQGGKSAWLFTGQGAQTLGMGKGLASEWPVFRETLEAVFSAVDGQLEVPLREVMWAEEGSEKAALLNQTAYTQPALFAVEVALAALWHSWGVEADYLVGHSIGELAAAHVAGVLTLQDAARLVVARGKLMQALPTGGAMYAISATEEEVAAAVADRSGRVSIGAVNGPKSVVVSGVEADAKAIAEAFAAKGARTRRLEVSHAFHSPLMDPMLAAFRKVAESVTYSAPTKQLVSNVTGALAGAEVQTAEYWVKHVREAVRFAAGVRTLGESGVTTWLELGPKATLLGLLPACLPEEKQGALLASLRADRPEPEAIAEALAGHWAQGGALEWKAVFPKNARRVLLPTYAWQKQRYWVEEATASSRAGEATGHPLLGVWVALAAGATVYESRLSRREQPWLFDHRVAGQVVFPGAGLAELIRAAAEHQTADSAEVTSLILQAPMMLPEKGAQRVQVVLSEVDGRAEATVYSQPEGGERSSWTLHARAEVRRRNTDAVPAPLDLASIRQRCSTPVDVSAFYDAVAAAGLAYGPSFRGMTALWRGEGEAVAELVLPQTLERAEDYGVHPALLDAAFHATMAGLGEPGGELELPFAMDQVVVHAPGVRTAFAWVRPGTNAEGGRSVDVTLTSAAGEVLFELTGLRARAARTEALKSGDTNLVDARFSIEWTPSTTRDAGLPQGDWLIVAPEGDEVAASLAERLRASGATCATLRAAEVQSDVSAKNVVCLWPTVEAGRDVASVLNTSTSALAVAQNLGRAATPPRVWWFTSAAVSVAADEAPSLAGAGVWGLGRTVAQEAPDLRLTLVDLAPASSPADTAQLLLRELATGDDEQQVAWRGGQRHVARLVRAPLTVATTATDTTLDARDTSPGKTNLRTDGAVLVTGGLGALGLHVCRWLASQGVRRLILTSRRGSQTPGAAEAVGELEALGAQVTVAAVDVADQTALEALLSGLDVPLRGVVHTAGVLADAVLADQSPEHFARVFAPKVGGAVNLDVLTRGQELDLFVLFSSAAGTFGAAGQASYAAANATLDALAQSRRAEGLPAQSLSWGAWTDGGMASGLGAAQQARLTREGLKAMSPEQGIALLDSAVKGGEPHLVLVPANLRQLAKAMADGVPPLFRSLVRSPRRAAASHGAWAQSLAAMEPSRRQEVALELVRSEAARVLSLGSANDAPADRPLQELGLDSLTAVELRNGLGKRSGTTLPSTLVFDHPTPRAIAEFLLKKVSAIWDTARAAPPAKQSRTDSVVEEPIAIVGMACRYPGGVTDPASLWKLLEGGVDAVTEVPKERWDVDALYDPDPDALGKVMTRSGGFLGDVDRFDPAFFGISPGEAANMDPQHRLLLETSWEALEHAGIAPDGLVGSSTGVFTGLMYQEYGTLVGDLEKFDGTVGTGNTGSVASGRVSYTLGLQGPSLTLDTACSSSLVTVHLAAQALKQGECSLALAGGVTLMLTPIAFVEFSRLRGLSPDGRCKPFSAEADGVGWAEGCGMLVLERLSDARRNGHPVLAVIRGTAVNQDGRSNGLTAPNGPSQETVIRRALSQAGVRPGDVQYVECHGTGTPLGDPIEVQALGSVLAEGRDPAEPVVIGSIKSNVGHTQAAAGAAGIMKVVLALQNERIPRSLHSDAPSQHIAWDELPVKVATQPLPWPRGRRPRIAGVSSFGVSGTNAHVVLQEAPPEEIVSNEAAAELPVKSSAMPFVLSGRTEGALRSQARALEAHLAVMSGDVPLRDLAWSLAATRAKLEHRAAIVASDVESLKASLQAVAEGRIGDGTVTGRATRDGKVVFVFPGQGSQWVGMALPLLESSSVFREQLQACERAFAPHVQWSLLSVLRGDEGAPSLERVDVVQPVLFAVMVSLAALWRSLGVEPRAVIGHSQGEIAAAYVAGALSLEDAAKIVTRRSQALTRIGGKGAMAAAEIELPALEQRLQKFGNRLSIAAVNSPRSLLVSGDPEAIDQLVGELTADNHFARKVRVDYASHSVHVEPLHEEILQQLAGVTPREATVPLYSTVTGERLRGDELDPAYWYRNLRQTVRFQEVTERLAAEGHRYFIEVSPHPVLTLALDATCATSPGEPVVVGSLRRDEGTFARLLTSVCQLHVAGLTFDPDRVLPGGRRVPLPTYAFQRERHWLDAPRRMGAGGSLGTTEHPLVSSVTMVADTGGVLITSRLSLSDQPWLRSHAVFGNVLFPGAGFVEMALFAAARVGLERVETLTLEEALAVPPRGAVVLQIAVSALDEDGRRTLSFHARAEDAAADVPWTQHATGSLGPGLAQQTSFDLEVWPPKDAEAVPTEGLYARLAEAGYGYGPDFQGLKAVWRRGEALFAEVALPEIPAREAARYSLHPVLLDAALHALAAEALKGGSVALPFEWNGVSLKAVGASTLRVRFERRTGEIALSLADAAGQSVGEVEALASRPVSAEQLRGALGRRREGLYRIDWVERSSGPAASAERWAILGGPEPLLEQGLTEAGVAFERVADLSAISATIDAGGVPPEVVAVCLPVARNASTTTSGAAGVPYGEVGDQLDGAYGATTDCLRLLQQWLSDERLAARKLVFVTRRSVAARSGEDVLNLAHAPVWGLVRSAQSERPDTALFLVDSDGTTASARALPAALDADEPQCVLRDGTRWVPRLSAATEPVPEAQTPEEVTTAQTRTLDPAGTVLVTGGTGMLGALFARHLVKAHGVRHLLLTSRQGPGAPGAAALKQELEQLGAHVTIAACDVAQRPALEALLTSIPAAHPLTAILHSTGILDDGLMASLTPERLQTVMRSKVDAAFHLHDLTLKQKVSAFVVFGSVAGVLGSPGQANYAAANAALDALAQHRRAVGLPAVCLHWGYWAEQSAMTAHLSKIDVRRMTQGGMRPLTREEGVALFDAALSRRDAALVAAPLDLRAIKGPVHPLLRGLVRTRAVRQAANAASALALKQKLLPLSEAERASAVLELVRSEAAAVLGLASAAAVDAQRPLQELGLDSLKAVELRNRLANAAGARFQATLLFNHPTCAALAQLVQEKVLEGAGSADRLSAELDKVEGTLASLYADEALRERLVTRLQGLVSKWTKPPVTAESTALADKLDNASEEEFLKLIDTLTS